MNQNTQKTVIDWSAHLKAQQESGLTIKAYCTEHTLNYDQFGYYKRKLLGSSQRNSKAPTGFAAVDMKSAQPTSLATLSLMLPSGIRIEGIDDNNLSVCVNLLSRLS